MVQFMPRHRKLPSVARTPLLRDVRRFGSARRDCNLVLNRTARLAFLEHDLPIDQAQHRARYSTGKTTMFKKILTGALVAATLAGATVATTGTAEAHYGQNGAFAAGAALGLLGGAIAGSAYSNDGYYESEPVYYHHTCYIER